MRIKLLFIIFFLGTYSYSADIPVEICELINMDLYASSDPHIQKDDFTISPNPAKNNLNIKLFQNIGKVTVEAFDVLGKRIYKGQFSQLETSINISGWKSGVYLVRVSNSKINQTKRFVKQ